MSLSTAYVRSISRGTRSSRAKRSLKKREKRVRSRLRTIAFTGATLTDAAQLEAELRQIRKEQVSFDREEYLVGVVCMAVPVIGRNGELLAALAIQAPQARMNVQTARRHLPALRHAAGELAGIFQDRP